MNYFYQVDSFASQRFKGNPAAVCVLEKFPDSRIMQNIAKEMNLSETAFVVKDENEYNLKWFTPTFEIDLCGHATLATAHILWTEGFCKKDKPITFNTRSGKLIISFVDGLIEMNFPAIDYSKIDCIPEVLIQGLGGVKTVFNGKSKENYLLELATQQEVEAIKIDISKLLECKMHGVIVTAKGHDKYDFVSRYFAPEAGVPEDPVTGSAHCVLARFWSDKLGINKFKAYQCSERGGEIDVVLLNDRVILRGYAVTVIRGELID